MRRPAKQGFSSSSYRPGNTVEEEPAIYYHNAWSLPTLKCFANRNLKSLDETDVTEVAPADTNSSKSPSHHEDPNSPYRPPPRPQPTFDFNNIDTRNRINNFFMTDN